MKQQGERTRYTPLDFGSQEDMFYCWLIPETCKSLGSFMSVPVKAYACVTWLFEQHKIFIWCCVEFSSVPALKRPARSLCPKLLSSSTKNRLWRIDGYKGNACGAKRLPCSAVVGVYENDSRDWSDTAGKIYLANGIISGAAQKVVCCSADSAGRKERQGNGPQRIWR